MLKTLIISLIISYFMFAWICLVMIATKVAKLRCSVLTECYQSFVDPAIFINQSEKSD